MINDRKQNEKVTKRSGVMSVSALDGLACKSGAARFVVIGGLAHLVGAGWLAIIGRDRLLLSARGYVGKGGFARVIQVPARYTFLSAVPILKILSQKLNYLFLESKIWKCCIRCTPRPEVEKK